MGEELAIMHNKIHWGFKPTFLNILLLCAGILLNFGGKWISDTFLLPFWLDSIGTSLTACILGPFAGALTGGTYNLLFALCYSANFCYMLTSISIGIIVGRLYPKNNTDLFQIVCTAAITAITTVAVTAPLNFFFQHGHTGNLWGDALFDMLQQNGNHRIFCAVIGEAFVDIPDKVLCLFIVAGILYCKDRIQALPVKKGAKS